MSDKLLLDADILIYQAASTVETPINWGDGMWTLHAHEDDAKGAFILACERIVGSWKGEVAMAISDGANFRKLDVDPTYKGNRKDVRKPMLLPFMRQWVQENYKTLMFPKLEADDVLGIMGTRGEYVIWSADKDLQTIPCTQWDGKDKYLVTEEQADYQFFMQTLTGDSTDGYAGCPKVGPKTAEKILQVEATWEKVVEAFVKNGLNESEALTQARLARILRDSDWNEDRQEVILWSP